MIASMYTERACNNIQHPFFIFKNSLVNQKSGVLLQPESKCTYKILKKSL